MCISLCTRKSQEKLFLHVEYKKKGKCGRIKMCKFGNNTVQKLHLKLRLTKISP